MRYSDHEQRLLDQQSGAESDRRAKTVEAKPTPGSWTNDKHSTYVWSEFGNICSCGDPHASGYVGYTPADIGSQYLDEAVANARLISAAPDMLPILQKLDAWWTQEWPCGPVASDGIVHLTDETIELWVAIRAAIAKATSDTASP